MKLSGDVKGAR